MYLYIYIYNIYIIYIHTYIHTYICLSNTPAQGKRGTVNAIPRGGVWNIYIPTSVHRYVYLYAYTYIIYIYIHTYIHTYVYQLLPLKAKEAQLTQYLAAAHGIYIY